MSDFTAGQNVFLVGAKGQHRCHLIAINARTMPRDGAIIFNDLLGNLDALEIACDKCGRNGRYAVARLIEQRGRDAKAVDFLAEITADCPKIANAQKCFPLMVITAFATPSLFGRTILTGMVSDPRTRVRV